MNSGRAAAWTVVAVVVAVTLASGPLLGSVGFAESRVQGGAASGNATVGGVSVPERMTLTYRDDSEAFALRIADGSITFRNVTGGDVQVTFAVRVRAWDFTAQRLHVVGEGTTGTRLLAIRNGTVTSIAPEAGEYEGTVYVILQSAGGEQVLRERTIEVVVRR